MHVTRMGHMDGMHGKSWTETVKERCYVALNRRLLACGYRINVLYFGDWFRVLSGSGVCEQGISGYCVVGRDCMWR